MSLSDDHNDQLLVVKSADLPSDQDDYIEETKKRRST